MNPLRSARSRAPLPVLALAVLAVPAAAFEPMRDCAPDLHRKFTGTKEYLQTGEPEALRQRLPVFHRVMGEMSAWTDETLWPLKDGAALPAACRIDAGRIKDEIYGDLSRLRGLIDDKTLDGLPEAERAAAEALTARESDVDALMGDRAKSLPEFRTALARLEGGPAAAVPESLKPRAEKLAARLKDIRARVAKSGETGASPLGAAMPEAVRERLAKQESGADARARAAMKDGFEPERKDASPGAPAAGGAASRHEGAGAAPAEAPKRVRAPRGADPIDRAELGGGEKPRPEGTGAAAGAAIKNSAALPLGGAVAPRSAEEESGYLRRKEASKLAAERFMTEGGFAELEGTENLGFGVTGGARNGAGTYNVIREGAPPIVIPVVNGKLVVKAGQLTPEEEGFLEAKLSKE